MDVFCMDAASTSAKESVMFVVIVLMSWFFGKKEDTSYSWNNGPIDEVGGSEEKGFNGHPDNGCPDWKNNNQRQVWQNSSSQGRRTVKTTHLQCLRCGAEWDVVS